jgi:hypothetical protein
VDDHHGSLIQGLEGDPSAHDNYYANDPRSIGEVVEKSKKNLFCDAKLGK